MIADTATIEAGAQLGTGVLVEDFVVVRAGAIVGDGCYLRAGTIVYSEAVLRSSVQTGHHVVIRSGSVVGEGTLIGTHTVLDGDLSIGRHCRLQTAGYVPPGCTIGDRCFLGPGASLTNDRRAGSHMRGLSQAGDAWQGATLGYGVRVGARAVLLDGISLGDECFVAAGAVVTRSVAAGRLVRGVPAVDVGAVPPGEELPDHD